MGQSNSETRSGDGGSIRVGFVIDSLLPGAGTENQLTLLLERFDRARVAPRLACLWHNPALDALGLEPPPEILGFRRLAAPEGVRGIVRLRGWIRRERLDLVVTFFRDANIAGTLAAGLARRPVVSTRRNLGWWHTPREVAVLRVLDRMTARFVANSEAVAERAREVERLDPRRIEVIPNAVDTARFRPPDPGEREAARRALELDGNGPVVGCVGNLRPVKDHRGLLAAWERVLESLPEARLVLAGDGPEAGALRELAAPFGKSVRFLGAREDVPALLQAFDLGVLPSVSEGSSNALLEYLASGLPAVATAVGGSPEILAGRSFGRLVPSGNPAALAEALIQAAKEQGRTTGPGEEARRYVLATRSIPAVMEAWYRLFERFRTGKGQ